VTALLIGVPLVLLGALVLLLVGRSVRPGGWRGPGRSAAVSGRVVVRYTCAVPLEPPQDANVSLSLKKSIRHPTSDVAGRAHHRDHPGLPPYPITPRNSPAAVVDGQSDIPSPAWPPVGEVSRNCHSASQPLFSSHMYADVAWARQPRGSGAASTIRVGANARDGKLRGCETDKGRSFTLTEGTRAESRQDQLTAGRRSEGVRQSILRRQR
jgi:hypothetical protein